MSAALTCFQVPVHDTGAHMYRHHETEPQPSYSNNGYNPYLIDPEFPADADHTENFYDQVQYSRLPPGPGTSAYQDAGSGVVRYGRTMQDEEVSSPQLICPSPSLPPSQFPPQYLWSNWPSEAPINVYQAYGPSSSHRHTHSSESPRATNIQHSFENQQALVSGFYPAQQEFVEAGPNGISTPFHHGDSGYTQQPFLISTASSGFQSNQSNDLTALQPRYYATLAHQPIPPEKCSSYSELAPNLSFMNNQAQPPLVRRETIQTQGHYTPKGVSEDVIPKRTATPSHDTKKTPYVLGLLNGPPLTSIGRKVQPPSSPPHYIAMNNTATPAANTIKTKSSRSVHDPRRSSLLACTNIACGRPPDGSGAAPTCKQCARRSFRRYSQDIKSTQPLVRSRASSKDTSSPLSLKRK